MNLHRSKAYPEWHSTPRADMNQFQVVAARTKGVITPGNVLTITGFIVALAGLLAILQRNYLVGFIGVFGGRLFDVADGYAADKTATKSPLGESLDAGFDKLITLFTLLVLGISGVVAWWLLLSILVVNVAIAGIGALGLARQQRLHPSKAGKLSMGLVWLSLPGLVLLKALDAPSGLTGGLYVAGVGSVFLAIVAFVEYVVAYTAKTN